MYFITRQRNCEGSSGTAGRHIIRLAPTVLLCACIFAQGCAEQESPIKTFVAQLEHAESLERYSAVKALGSYGPEAHEAVPQIAEALADQDAMVRMGAAYALANIGHAAAPAVPALKQALHDRDARVRLAAAYALPALGPHAADALKDLRIRLGDFNEEVREEARRAVHLIELAQKYQDVSLPQGSDEQ